MVWPALTILALLALASAYFHWRKKFLHAQELARIDIEKIREEQQRAAVQTQRQQEALFNSMVEGLLLLDKNGRIQLANRAFTNLFEIANDFHGKTILEALRAHELAEMVESLSNEKQALDKELRLPGPKERWLNINAAAVFNHDGQRQGTVLVFHDLTRLKQLERTREEFVGNVSHELRTPLSLIKGYVETLLDGAKDNPETASKFLHTIDRNAERLRLLIEDLLTISKLESGQITLNLQPVGLRSLVEKVFSDLRSPAAEKNVNLVNQAPKLNVRADPNRLEQVFVNFVDNAIKYGHTDGTVTVGGTADGNGSVEIFVRDDGPGIPAEALERVFERFYRVDKARSREQGGTGLGLSIVKHIVQNHGGRVWSKSELGRGTTFFFTLPIESV